MSASGVKKPFWSRPKVGVVALVVGMSIGVASEGAETERPKTSQAAPDTSEADLEEAVEQNAELEDQLTDERAEADAALQEVQQDADATQREAVAAAVAKVRKQERRKTAAAVRAATAAAAPPAPPAPKPANSVPVPLVSNGAATDPRFSYCYEANDAGFGPYQRGQDPEYDWYDDRDGDGVVCEY